MLEERHKWTQKQRQERLKLRFQKRNNADLPSIEVDTVTPSVADNRGVHAKCRQIQILLFFLVSFTIFLER